MLAAGSFMHFALAFFLLVLLAAGLGLENNNTTAIGNVDSCVQASVQALDQQSCSGSLGTSPALKAGIKSGDKIISIGGKRVRSWTQLGAAIRALPPGHPAP